MNHTFVKLFVLVVLVSPSLSLAQFLPSSGNLQLWFRADAGVTTNGTGNVSTWADQSGNANNATNLTVANQPLWLDNILNGKPVLRFDGANDVLSSLNNVNLTNGLSIFIIAKNATRKNYQGIFRIGAVPYTDASNLEVYWQQGDFDTGSGHLIYGLNRSTGTFGGLQSLNAPPPVGNYYVFDVIASGITATQRVNGITPASSSLGAPKVPSGVNPAHIGIGYGGVGTSGLLSGDIAEVLVYDSALSTSDRTYVENYLADKYGLTIPEAGTITYVGMSIAALLIARRRRHWNT